MDDQKRIEALEAQVKTLEDRQKAWEVLMALQQKNMETLKRGLDAHQTLLSALGGLEMRRHGKHSAN